ncbi:MAG: hypothetical protein OYH76_00550 [Defluviicoccus sp.]|nr:hypothetical protein [Defluviicoccus sp.]MDE0274353.1 hypothetical protein [Defluviicoccus sp.]
MLTDDLLQTHARLGGKPLAPGEGGEALDERGGSVEVEVMLVLPPGPEKVWSARSSSRPCQAKT